MPNPPVTPIPLMPGRWRPLGDPESKLFRQRVSDRLTARGGPTTHQPLAHMKNLRAMPLSFYPGWFLVEGEAPVTDDLQGTFDVLYGPGLFWVIDGNSPFLHQLNAGGVPKDIDAQDSVSSATTLGTPRVERLHSPLIELDETTTGPDYLRFFCASIWGQEGPFMLVEGLDSPLLVGIDIDDKPWLDEIKPLQMTRDGDDLVGQGVVAYAQNLFAARFRVKHGMVVMEDDRELADTELMPQQFIAPFRHLRPIAASTQEKGSA